MSMATTIIDRHASNINSRVLLKRPLGDPSSQNGKEVSKKLIGAALSQRIDEIDHEVCHPGDEDTFFVADLGEVYRQHLRWKQTLPRVKPFYGE
jgi:ornithine decarboxylase